MKSKILFVLVLSLLAAGSGLAAPPPADGAAAVDAAWMKAFKANDIEGVMACYALDAVLWLPDAPGANGAAAIRETYRGFFAQNKVQDVAIVEPHYETVGSRSVAWGKFSMTLLPKGADKPVVATGRFTEISEKRNGRWVYSVDHASIDPPPATSPAAK